MSNVMLYVYVGILAVILLLLIEAIYDEAPFNKSNILYGIYMCALAVSLAVFVVVVIFY